jgi:hypothetical protein
MANRHKAFRKGGRAEGGRANDKFKRNYSSPGGNREAGEAASEKEEFATGGTVQLSRAHGGATKKRGDRGGFKKGGKAAPFKEGGSVWSKAAGGLRGKRGFGGAPEIPGKHHGETFDTSVHGTTSSRQTHSGAAKHQQKAAGGPVFAKRAKGGKCEKPYDEDEED